MSSMLLLLNSHPPEGGLPRLLDTQFIHSHSAENTCHVRLVIAILEHPTATDDSPMMHVSLSGIRVSRAIARWTSFARVAVELDIDSSDPEVLLGSYQFMDMVMYNRLEHYMEALLEGAVPNPVAASDVCTQIMERAAMSSYATIRRFVHKFKFLSFISGEETLARLSFVDFRARCRQHGSDLFYCIFDDDTTVVPTVPCIVLSPQQVLHVRTALSGEYQVDLLSYDEAGLRRINDDEAMGPEGNIEGGSISSWTFGCLPFDCISGGVKRRAKPDLLAKIALRVALPVVGSHLNEQLLTHLLASDSKLASSVSRGANAQQVVEALAAGCRRAGLTDHARMISGIPHPTSIADDPIAQLHALAPSGAGAASNSSRTVTSPQPAEQAAADLPELLSTLRTEFDALSFDVKSVVSWAEQFEHTDSPPGTVVRDVLHFQLADQFVQARADISATKEELSATINALSDRLQRLQSNHIRLEGLLVLYKQQAQGMLDQMRTERAASTNAVQQCQDILTQVSSTRSSLKTDSSSMTPPALFATLGLTCGRTRLLMQVGLLAQRTYAQVQEVARKQDGYSVHRLGALYSTLGERVAALESAWGVVAPTQGCVTVSLAPAIPSQDGVAPPRGTQASDDDSVQIVGEDFESS
eukprot:4797755-Amphidinium_carterae.1